MTQRKKRHHLNPVLLLRNFTEGGRHKSKVWVFDRARSAIRNGDPSTVAFRNNFYRISADGVPENAVEDFFSKVEGIATTTIREIVSTRTLPDSASDDHANLMYFAALMHARSPRHREVLMSSREEQQRMQLAMLARDDQLWDRFLMSDAGRQYRGRSRSELIAYWQTDPTSFPADQVAQQHTISTVIMLPQLAEYVARRHWSLLVTLPEGPYFITSESPLSISWKEPLGSEIWRYGAPGLIASSSTIYLPLSKDVAILGDSDSPDTPVIELSGDAVDRMNHRMLRFSGDIVFGPESAFCWMDEYGNMWSERHWLGKGR